MSFGGAKKNKQPEPAWRQFLLGGLSGCAAAVCTHPIDLIKVRMQVAGTNTPKDGMFKTGYKVVTNEGVPAIYKGLTASLLRQASYTTVRFGLYLDLKERLSTPGEDLPLWKKFFTSMAAGAGGAVVGSPADVVLVRMQADGRLPVEQRRNYRNAVDGLYQIVRQEGVFSLWKGCVPNVYRAMFMSAGQLASYDQSKQILLKNTTFFKDNLVTHFTASLMAAFVATVITNPFDVIKTRIMNQQKQQSPGDVVYKSSVDCAMKIIKNEGPAGFYKGFFPYFMRLGPHTILTFIFFERFAIVLDKLAGSTTNKD